MKNKDKYDLTKLTFKIEGENNPSQVFKILDGTNVVFEKPILLNRVDLILFLSWLEEEYDPKILTEKEKAYLSAVIKPFRERIECVKKIVFKRAFIKIFLEDEAVALPYFEKDIMYTGMEEGREYTLEELGL